MTPDEASPAASGLDRLIAPEIKDDAFYRAIVQVAATPGVRHVLEIGSSSGAGSTEAWVRGALQNSEPPIIHCLEVSTVRFAALALRWKDYPFVRCYNRSSVPLEAFPSEDDIVRFQRRWWWSKFGRKSRDKVLGWLRQDIEYLASHGASADGIAEVQRAAGVEHFDAVLIDGSEFTGTAELERVYGARFILLDDTRSYKNWDSLRRLSADPAYRCKMKSRWTRNGFAVFERRG